MHQPTTPVRLELKYCERCGSLWLRQVGTNATYCTPCAHEMAEVAYRGPRARIREEPTDLDLDAAMDGPPPRRGRPPLFLMRPGPHTPQLGRCL